MDVINTTNQGTIIYTATEFQELLKDIYNHKYAGNTKKNYQSDFKNFYIWCDKEKITLSADNLILTITKYADYLLEQKKRKVSL